MCVCVLWPRHSALARAGGPLARGPPPAAMVLRCPVCLEDKALPQPLPGCRAHHTHAGAVCGAAAPPPARVDERGVAYASACCVPMDRWTPLRLLSVAAASHDSALFEFALPEGARALGLPTCACLLARAPGCEHGGGDAVRPYTPVAETPAEEGEGEDGGGGDRAGSFTLLVKRYAAWGDPRHAHSYRPAGAVSNHVFGLVPGVDSLEFKHVPANVKLPYAHPCGSMGFRTAAGERVRTITMVAVGVGVAPMAQALREMLDDGAADDTRVVLLYGNRSVRDILLRDTLDEWEERHPERFKVVHHIGSRFGAHSRAAKSRPALAPSLPPSSRVGMLSDRSDLPPTNTRPVHTRTSSRAAAAARQATTSTCTSTTARRTAANRARGAACRSQRASTRCARTGANSAG